MPSMAEFEKRLRNRGTETEKSLQTRLANASGEMEVLTSKLDVFNYRIVNDKLDVTKRIVELLIPALYCEELDGLSTPRLIEETPVLKDSFPPRFS